MERKIGLSSAAPFEGLSAPRIPIHRIVRVLEKIGALLVGKSVGVHGGLHFDSPIGYAGSVIRLALLLLCMIPFALARSGNDVTFAERRRKASPGF